MNLDHESFASAGTAFGENHKASPYCTLSYILNKQLIITFPFLVEKGTAVRGIAQNLAIVETADELHDKKNVIYIFYA